MSKRVKGKAKPVTGDILDFHSELTDLLDRYSEAGCCPGCLSEGLVRAAVGMIVTTGGICWPAAHPEEVEMLAELARRVVGRALGAPSGVTLQWSPWLANEQTLPILLPLIVERLYERPMRSQGYSGHDLIAWGWRHPLVGS